MDNGQYRVDKIRDHPLIDYSFDIPFTLFHVPIDSPRKHDIRIAFHEDLDKG